jgi:hypothetical protein
MGFGAEMRQEKGVDRSVTARSNLGSPFVCNKTSTPGWGLAEGRRQRAAKGLPESPKLPKLTIVNSTE